MFFKETNNHPLGIENGEMGEVGRHSREIPAAFCPTGWPNGREHGKGEESIPEIGHCQPTKMALNHVIIVTIDAIDGIILPVRTSS